MVKTEGEKSGTKKLVKERPPASLEKSVSLSNEFSSTNKLSLLRDNSNRAAPHIRRHQVKGHTYYSYVRGTDQEIYLGSADIILKAVQAYRQRQQLEGGE